MSDRTFAILATVFFAWMAVAFYCLFSTEPEIQAALAFVRGLKQLLP